MPSRTGISAGRRLAGWLGAAVTALLAVAVVLAAAGPARADSGPIGGVRAGFATGMPQASVKAAEAQVPVKTVTAEYSCDFAGYGSGIPAATVAAAYAVPTTWPVNNPDPIALATDTLSLPSQVSGQLGGVTSFQVQTTVQAQHATAATVTVVGDSTDTLPNPPTQVPQIASAGQVTFPAQGTGTVKLPPATIVITPFVNTTGEPNITCTTTTAAQDVSITVGKATGQFYKCTLTVSGNSETSSGFVDMTFTASGQRTVGATDTVTLSATDFVGLSDLPTGLTAAFSGSLAVQGAQSGSVKLTGTGPTGSTAPFTAKGTLRLAKAGTVRLLIPQTFALTLSAQGASIPISCALQTSPAPTALTIAVSQGPGHSGGGSPGTHGGTSGTNHNGTSGASSTTSGSSSSTTEGGGTPVGAPATGGGLGLASGSTPAAAGAGAALTAIGGALLLWARRRRTGERPAGELGSPRRGRSS